jgi:CBS domain-containing protein
MPAKRAGRTQISRRLHGHETAVVADANEPLRLAVNRMAEKQLTRIPVIDSEAGGALSGMISLEDL